MQQDTTTAFYEEITTTEDFKPAKAEHSCTDVIKTEENLAYQTKEATITQ